MKFEWDFDGGRDGFAYRDDVFEFTSQPGYARGGYTSTGGYDGGGLRVRLGGRDNADITDMSGGWSKSFTLDEAQQVSLTFRYKLTQSSAYEADEYSEVRVALDGCDVSVNGQDYVARISGDGGGGSAISTGWRTVTIDLGELEAGRHSFTLGGFNNKKTESSESTLITFDDVTVEAKASKPTAPTAPDTTASAELEAFEARVLELTNSFRVENGKAPFQNDAKLNAAAEGWSEAMAKGDFFRHSTPEQVEQEGYQWRSWGENIAVGYRTPEAVVQGWINSPGHRANMLSDDFKEIGVGHYYLAEDSGSVNYNHYWTQTFATEAGALLSA